MTSTFTVVASTVVVFMGVNLGQIQNLTTQIITAIGSIVAIVGTIIGYLKRYNLLPHVPWIARGFVGGKINDLVTDAEKYITTALGDPSSIDGVNRLRFAKVAGELRTRWPVLFAGMTDEGIEVFVKAALKATANIRSA